MILTTTIVVEGRELVGSVALRAAGLAFGLIAWTAAASGALADDGAGLEFITAADPPVTVEFVASATGPTATLSVTLANNAQVAATVTFALVESGKRVEAGARTEGLRLTVAPEPDPTIPKGDVRAYKLVIDLPVDAESFSAVLIAEDAPGNVGPATLVLKGSPVPGKPLAAAKAQPASVSITRTRSVPAGIGRDIGCWIWPPDAQTQATVHATGIGKLPADLGTQPPVEAYIGSDTGGRLFVRLAPPTKTPVDDLVVSLGCAERAGTYTGDISLDPGNDEAATVSLTVKVQDFVLWPILAVLTGSVLAYLLKWRGDRKRPKDILQLALSNAREDYRVKAKENKKEKKEPDDRTILDDVFGGAAWPNDSSVSGELYVEIGKARTKEHLDALAVTVVDIVKLADSYDGIVAARAALRAQLSGPISEKEDAAKLRAAGRALLAQTQLTSSAAAEAHRAAISKQMTATVTWLRANRLAGVAAALFRRLPSDLPEWIADEAKLANPAGICAGYLRQAESLDDLERPDVIGKLQESIRILALALTVSGGVDGDENRRLQRLVAAGTGEGIEGAPIVPPLAVPDRRLASIRRLDRLEFVVVALIAVGLFLGTAYVDKAFGTAWNYLAAFLTGAAGTVTINFTLLPWYRSYRATAPKS
jgi:hypothetical protein